LNGIRTYIISEVIASLYRGEFFEYSLPACKMAAGVLASFTQSGYYGRGERPNTKLADKSSSSGRRK
jgi:hypothetical protein